MTIPNEPVAEAVIPPNKADANESEINGLLDMFKMKSEMKLNPGAKVMITPKATAEPVNNMGIIPEFAPSLINYRYNLDFYIIKIIKISQ